MAGEDELESHKKSLDAIYNELNGASDRATILVGAALLEDALQQCIAARLPRRYQDQKEQDELFGDRGCFNTFSLKINGAYFLQIIGPVTKRDLHLVRKIRNEAAHEMHNISFAETQKIASLCRELKFFQIEPHRVEDSGLRNHFLATVSFFNSCLLLRAHNIDSFSTRQLDR